jgi:uncharacterized protein (TIGR03083 family)
VPQDRKTALRQELVDAQLQLRQVLNRVEPEDWSRVSPANEGWSVQQILTHLTTAETGFIGTLKRMAAGEGGVPADFDPNRWNAGQLRRNADVSPQELRTQIEKSHQDMLALLDSIDESALDHRGHLSSGVDGSTEDNFRLVAYHKRGHTDDIRAALKARAQA